MSDIKVQDLLAHVSVVAGERVRLHQARLSDGSPVYAVVPAVAGRLQMPLWQKVRRAPSGGVWTSPAAAIVGFTSLVSQTTGSDRRPTQEWLQRRLQALLEARPMTVVEVRSMLEEEGATWRQIDRAARSIGVVRQKVGMMGGWTWQWRRPTAGTGASEESR